MKQSRFGKHIFILTLQAFLLMALLTSPCSAKDLLILNDNSGSYALGLHLYYLKDAKGNLTLEQVMSPEEHGTFKKSTREVPNFSFTKSVYWFRFELKNESRSVTKWLLENQYPLLNHIDAFLVYPGKSVITYRSGDSLPFSNRAVKHRNVNFEIPLAEGESVTVFLRVKTESSMQVPLRLWSPQGFHAKDHEEQFALGLYYGILFALFLYNFLIFLSIREIVYFRYLHYVLGYILFQMSLNGLAFEYLWPENLWLQSIATPFFIGFAYIGGIQFSYSFLQLKENLPHYYNIARIFFWAFIAVVISSLTLSYSFAIKLGIILTFPATIFVITAGIVCMKRKIRQAKYFMLAWAAFLSGVITYALKTIGVLPTNFISEYGMQIGNAMEVLLLSFALAHRMKLLKEENERIHKEATETLELSVKQRTCELDLALMRLSDVNEKLRDLNQIDVLTGVKNRSFFNDKLELEWRRGQREQTNLGLLLLDIDHFKKMNDTLGHLCGDACLKEVAVRISQSIHRPGDDLSRYGGEEFAIILPNTDMEGSGHIAEVIRKRVEELEIMFEINKLRLTVSVGVSSIIPQKETSFDILISNADSALYQAKHNGRNQVRCFFKPLLEI